MTHRRSSAADWTAAALEALATGGVAAVAVEPLAARLGTTTGSFHQHFRSREALLDAVLRHWERSHTDDVIALVESEPDARSRLRTLLTMTIGEHGRRPTGAVELALQPSAGHPLVAPVLARVTARRLGYLAVVFIELGFTPEQARQRALLAYSAYLGHAQLAHATPDEAPTRAALPDYVDEMIATLTAP